MTVNMPRAMRDRLGRLAFAEDRSVGWEVRRAVEIYLEHAARASRQAVPLLLLCLSTVCAAGVATLDGAPDLRRGPTAVRVVRGGRRNADGGAV